MAKSDRAIGWNSGVDAIAARTRVRDGLAQQRLGVRELPALHSLAAEEGVVEAVPSASP